MRLPNITGFYPAATSNYTKGREGLTPDRFTVHHEAGWSNTLRHLWANPARNGSSHLYAGLDNREQYVSLADTAWTNSNWQSNLRAITCETYGDWRNGYYNQAVLHNLRENMYQALKLFPNLRLTFHCDETDANRPTICPCDLKHKGYAAQMWNEAKNRISVENTPKPAPSAPVANLRVDIPDKKVILKRDTNIWDMSFTSFANAKAIGSLKAGTVIDVAGKYDHPLSKVDYYLSNYSWNKGLNNGISIADCDDYTPPVVVTPTPNTPPVGVPEPTTPPATDVGSGTAPPLPVDPNGKTVEQRLSAIEAFIESLKKLFKGL